MVRDVIDLLKADHRQVERWFDEFQGCNSMQREQELAQLICDAIRRHGRIDSDLFYPAFLAATGDEYKFEAMLREYRDIDDLLDEINPSGPAEDSFVTKIHLLCTMFEHHVLQEEKERGVFIEAAESGLDLQYLAQQVQVH